MAEHEKIRLLHLVQGLRIGGAEVLLTHYLKALGTKSYTHYVYNVWQDGPLRSTIEAMGIVVHNSEPKPSVKNPIRFLVWLIVLLRRLVIFVRQKDIGIIRSDVGFANQLAILLGKITVIPAFPTVHNTRAFNTPRYIWNLKVCLNALVDTLLYPRATKIIAISDEVKEIVRERFRSGEKQVVVVRNGIVFEEDTQDKEGLRDEFRSLDSGVRFIGVGALDYQKAFDVLVQAIYLVVKKGFESLHLLIVGEGAARRELESMIAEYNIAKYVRLLGIRHDVVKLMRMSDVFVMPSRYEGLSIAMIEAMACGLPIIGSDAPGLRDCIEHGTNGLLFPVDDHNELADRMRRLAENEALRVELGKGARNSFEREYDMKKNIKALDSLFQAYGEVKHVE